MKKRKQVYDEQIYDEWERTTGIDVKEAVRKIVELVKEEDRKNKEK